MLKISHPTLGKWIKDGFITPLKSKQIHGLEVFPPDAILKQLLKNKNSKAGIKQQNSSPYIIFE
jgi:hypothetical protein